MNKGIVFAALAYSCWGLFPLYFRTLADVSSLEIVMHRTVWSLVFLLAVLLVLRRWAWLPVLLKKPSVLAVFSLSALLLSANWLIYVWAVQNGHVLDASLGYFILPLVNVAMGYVLLHERPRPWQWIAVALASAGVFWLTFQAGHVPWIALLLALSFGFYGLLRKVSSLGALEGLALETMILAPIAVAVLAWWGGHGQGELIKGDLRMLGLLLLAGPLTAIPLLLFAAGARRVSLSTMGILQYISPSLQFALGVWVFDEAFEPTRLIGFALIWGALLIYSLEGLARMRATAATAPITPPNAGL